MGLVMCTVKDTKTVQGLGNILGFLNLTVFEKTTVSLPQAKSYHS